MNDTTGTLLRARDSSSPTKTGHCNDIALSSPAYSRLDCVSEPIYLISGRFRNIYLCNPIRFNIRCRRPHRERFEGLII